MKDRLSWRNTFLKVFLRVWIAGLFFITVNASGQDQQMHSTERAPVAYSLNGTPLYPPPESESSQHLKDSLLNIAETNYRRDSSNLDNIVWYGRRLAYLSRYPEAIGVYSRGLKKHPDSPELLRHRGHRYITTRQFNEAIADLSRAAVSVRGRRVKIEPDGVPNSMNSPLSSLQFNIWYHLGLAHYLKGDYDRAVVAYDSCMHYSTNPDLLCATTDWYYMTLIRSGRIGEAFILLDAITRGMEIIQNQGYYQRLLMYKGLNFPESLIRFDELTSENELTVVTQGYGVAFYLELQGRTEEAKQILNQIVNTSYWPAFGYIAAEADLSRL